MQEEIVLQGEVRSFSVNKKFTNHLPLFLL